jgi:hypothetical protein
MSAAGRDGRSSHRPQGTFARDCREAADWRHTTIVEEDE